MRAVSSKGREASGKGLGKRSHLLRTEGELRDFLRPFQRPGKGIGFVPTMGALHAGHLSLVERARRECGCVVVSVFVNPTQFGLGEDFERYPRNLEKDLALLAPHGPDAIFAPEIPVMYPPKACTWVWVDGPLSQVLEGQFRPGHFQGVATVVAGLFLLVQPERAYFGLKDYQQYLVIRQMTRDLHFPVEVVGCPTVREKDGLAMSSRNQYLNSRERQLAPRLHQALKRAAQLVRAGKKSAVEILRQAGALIRESGAFQVDYFSLVHPESLQGLKQLRRPALAIVAARLGKTRLIDNLLIR